MFAVIKMELYGKSVYGAVLKTTQRRDSGPWSMDLQVSRRLSRRPVVPSLFRPTASWRVRELSSYLSRSLHWLKITTIGDYSNFSHIGLCSNFKI